MLLRSFVAITTALLSPRVSAEESKNQSAENTGHTISDALTEHDHHRFQRLKDIMRFFSRIEKPILAKDSQANVNRVTG